jgi:hypothetical protein
MATKPATAATVTTKHLAAKLAEDHEMSKKQTRRSSAIWSRSSPST